MAGIMVEDFRYRCERLIELRRHLHEIARHRRSTQCVVVAVGEDAVQRMSELMEERGHLVPREQGRLSFRCLGTVEHIEDNRQLLAHATLLGESAHPRPAPFSGSPVQVAVEEGDRFPVLINHLKHLHVRMIDRNVEALLEREAIYQMCCIEHSVLLHAVHIEVRFHLLFGELEFLLFHFCRIVEAVVRLQLEIRSHRTAGILLNLPCLGISFR